MHASRNETRSPLAPRKSVILRSGRQQCTVVVVPAILRPLTSPACRSLPAIALMVLATATHLVSAQDMTGIPTDETLCELTIWGSAIERLELSSSTGRVVELDRPAETVTLPAGEFRVSAVDLRGGFYGLGPVTEASWFQLTPDKPVEIEVGAPLELQVKTGRRGRMLTVDYDLTDAAGCRYHGSRTDTPPTFSVFKDGQEIGSGSFEYG